ncbi:hypothetical protein L1987_60113 [Smallanthus sonchifolius]|uniref:Uncharacterized protein n=1 Tax=Smallanthus sonchifolius TaxID=185202 RepID=A0ACB9D7I3_9ASTR|nr:hypothetical protein L1987_60113 [Smallanthus sonchifolius]
MFGLLTAASNRVPEAKNPDLFVYLLHYFCQPPPLRDQEPLLHSNEKGDQESWNSNILKWVFGYFRPVMCTPRIVEALKCAVYVVDLIKFRETAVGDNLWVFYETLSKDPNSLSNLDQASAN